MSETVDLVVLTADGRKMRLNADHVLGTHLTRRWHTVCVTIGAGTAESEVIDKRNYSMVGIVMPVVWTAASLGVKVCPTAGGLFQQLRDESDALIELASPAAGRSYTFPVKLAPWPYFKLWSQNGAGVDANQAADVQITVVLMS